MQALSSSWVFGLGALRFGLLAMAVACGGEVTADAGSGGAGQVIGSGGAATGGGSSSGGAGGGISLEPPPSTLADDCELTAESTEWWRDEAGIACFATEDFFIGPRESDFEFPTFPGAGLGGAGGEAATSVETCPAASALEWTCQIGEGQSCSIPQCEYPTTPQPALGQCCYVVYLTAGV